MGRRRKFIDGNVVRACRFRKDVNDRLSMLPNASEFIQQAVDEKLSLFDDTILQTEIEIEKRLLRELEERALQYRKNIDKRESALQRRNLKRIGSQEIRLRYLALLSKLDERQLRNWLSSRADVMSECGFKTIEEAMEWVKEQEDG